MRQRSPPRTHTESESTHISVHRERGGFSVNMHKNVKEKKNFPCWLLLRCLWFNCYFYGFTQKLGFNETYEPS